MKNYFIVLFILSLLLLSACVQQPIQTQKTTTTEKIVEKPVATEIKAPAIIIISPKDSDLVKDSKVIIEVKEENFNIVPIGNPVKDGEGHFHVWLDNDRKVTTERTITFENITSGEHSIITELVNSDHPSLSPKVTKTILISVESDYVPPVPVQEQGVREYTVESDDDDFYPNKIQAKIGETVKINFKFRDSSIYYAGLDVKGPFEDIKYKLKGQQPITREFTMKAETIVKSYWPSSGVKKAELIVEVEI